MFLMCSFYSSIRKSILSAVYVYDITSYILTCMVLVVLVEHQNL